MAFLAGLMANVAGQGQGRTQAYQDALALQQQNQQFLEQQRQFDENLKLQRAAQGLDVNTGQPKPLNVPKNLSQILPNNKGKGTPTDTDFVRHYLGLAGANIDNPTAAQNLTTLAGQYGLSADRLSQAAYRSGPQTDKARAEVALDQARGKVLTQIQPQQFKAKLGMERDKYIAQLSGQYDRMQFNAKEREYLATLNASYRFAGYNMQDAFRASLDTYNQQSANWRAEVHGETNPLYEGPQPGAAPQAPVTINVGAGGPGGGPDPVTLAAYYLALSQGKNPKPPGEQTPKPKAGATLTDPEKAFVDRAFAMLRQHPETARHEIALKLQQGKITQSEADALNARFGFTGSARTSGTQGMGWGPEGWSGPSTGGRNTASPPQ